MLEQQAFNVDCLLKFVFIFLFGGLGILSMAIWNSMKPEINGVPYSLKVLPHCRLFENNSKRKKVTILIQKPMTLIVTDTFFLKEIWYFIRLNASMLLSPTKSLNASMKNRFLCHSLKKKATFRYRRRAIFFKFREIFFLFFFFFCKFLHIF